MLVKWIFQHLKTEILRKKERNPDQPTLKFEACYANIRFFLVLTTTSSAQSLH